MPKTEKRVASKDIQKIAPIQKLVKKEVSGGNFSPTKGMFGWLAKSFELGYSASLSDIAKAVGIQRDNWYQWLARPGFVEWWDSQWQLELKRVRWKLDSIGLKKAEKDYRFWKDMMNRTGNTIPELTQIGAQINTQFNIPNATVERITG